MKEQIFVERKRKNEEEILTKLYLYTLLIIPIRAHLHDFKAYGPVWLINKLETKWNFIFTVCLEY